MNEVMNVVRFRVVAASGLAAASASMDALFARQPGFRSRTLVGPDPDGLYLELILWRTREDCFEAMAALARELETAPFLNAIDSATIDVRVVPVVTRSPE